MLNPMDEWRAQERYRTLLRQAEQAHPARQAVGRAQVARPVYGPPLVWLGRRLSSWGLLLLARFDPSERGCATTGPR